MSQIVPVGDYTSAVVFAPSPEILLSETPEIQILVFNVGVLGGVGGGVTSWNDLEDKPVTFPPSAHTHPSSEISDSTAAGLALLSAADAAAQRTALGVSAAGVIRESSGPTSLAVGAIADGEPTARVGSTLVGMIGALWDAALTRLTFRRQNGGVANTEPTSGISLENTTAATSTQNQFSPALRFVAQGWRTNAPAGSAEVSFSVWLQPRTRPDTPNPQLIFQPTISGVKTRGIAFASNASANVVLPTGTYLTGLDGSGSYGPDQSFGFSGFGPTGGNNSFYAYCNSSPCFTFVTGGAGLPLNAVLGWASSGSGVPSFDVQLHRAAADTLALRRGTNAQTLRVNNTHTDASNGEWLSIGWASNRCTIEPRHNGTGTVRPLFMRLAPTTVANLPTAGASLAGMIGCVSDSSNPMLGHHGSVVTGGGSNVVPVFCDGVDWRIGG